MTHTPFRDEVIRLLRNIESRFPRAGRVLEHIHVLDENGCKQILEFLSQGDMKGFISFLAQETKNLSQEVDMIFIARGERNGKILRVYSDYIHLHDQKKAQDMIPYLDFC